jgi:uncharacterized integral membrane protein
MGSFYLILALVFSLLIAIMALANNETITVSYIFGRSDVSLILLILGSAFTGALVMGLFSLFRSIRSAFAFRQLRNQQDELQKRIDTLEVEKTFLEAELNRAISVGESNLFSEEEVEEEPAREAEALPDKTDQEEAEEKPS